MAWVGGGFIFGSFPPVWLPKSPSVFTISGVIAAALAGGMVLLNEVVWRNRRVHAMLVGFALAILLLTLVYFLAGKRLELMS